MRVTRIPQYVDINGYALPESVTRRSPVKREEREDFKVEFEAAVERLKGASECRGPLESLE